MIKASAPARIVNVSSNAHYPGSIHWEDIELLDDYSGMKAYAQSKLANVLFTYEMARRLEGDNVTVNALHPGVIASNFGATNNRRLIQLGQKLFKVFLTGVEKGAETSVFLATSPQVEGITGRYFEKLKPKTSSKASYSEPDQHRLWEVSERMLAELQVTGKDTVSSALHTGLPVPASQVA
jgi:NAD(P)-dependent dehydrogenase (short-subunit alcohol dehydrogenase family)